MAMNADDAAIRLLRFSYHSYLESGKRFGEAASYPHAEHVSITTPSRLTAVRNWCSTARSNIATLLDADHD
jgi:hypothetical protein